MALVWNTQYDDHSLLPYPTHLDLVEPLVAASANRQPAQAQDYLFTPQLCPSTLSSPSPPSSSSDVSFDAPLGQPLYPFEPHTLYSYPNHATTGPQKPTAAEFTVPIINSGVQHQHQDPAYAFDHLEYRRPPPIARSHGFHPYNGYAAPRQSWSDRRHASSGHAAATAAYANHARTAPPLITNFGQQNIYYQQHISPSTLSALSNFTSISSHNSEPPLAYISPAQLEYPRKSLETQPQSQQPYYLTQRGGLSTLDAVLALDTNLAGYPSYAAYDQIKEQQPITVLAPKDLHPPGRMPMMIAPQPTPIGWSSTPSPVTSVSIIDRLEREASKSECDDEAPHCSLVVEDEVPATVKPEDTTSDRDFSPEEESPVETRRASNKKAGKGSGGSQRTIAFACTFCRHRKIQCIPSSEPVSEDGETPACNQCEKRQRRCCYAPPNPTPRTVRKNRSKRAAAFDSP